MWCADRRWTCSPARGNGVELMSVHKYKNRGGKPLWAYQFSLPGSTRKDRKRVIQGGFATKAAAANAEAERRVEEQKKREIAASGAPVTEAVPKTLSALLEEFFRQHVDEKLAPKTIERYHEQAAYLDPALLQMQLTEITPCT